MIGSKVWCCESTGGFAACAEMSGLSRMIRADGNMEYEPGPFFSEQLTAFELWLSHGSKDKNPPEQLPVVLQVGCFTILIVGYPNIRA